MAKQENIRRGKNFSRLEDRQISVSWVYTTQDSIKGTDQNASAFWNNVYQNAITATPSLCSRTAEALRQRFGAISRNVMKFSGCVKSVQRLNKSGASSTDKQNMALELFKTDHKEDFKFLECYEVLKQCPKFMNVEMNVSKSSVTEAPCSSQNPSVSEIGTPSTRPIGQKAAKCKLRANEIENRKIIVLEQLSRAAKERNDIMRHSNRIKIITTSLNDLDEVSAKILKLEKQKILNELLSSSSLCDSPPTTDIDSSVAKSQEISSDEMIELATTSVGFTTPSSQSTAKAEELSSKSVRVPLMVHTMDGIHETFDPNSLIVSDYESD